MGVQIADPKAPWVMFERRAVEDRAESVKQGRYVAKDQDYVLLTPHGSKDQYEHLVSEWLPNMEQQVREQRLDPSWLNSWRKAYEDWCEGKETPVEGTAIINWPLISPAQVRMLQELHILTVESLAGANEQAIGRMGMGGRALVQKAQEYMKQYRDHGKATEEMVTMKDRLEQLEALTRQQAELIAQFKPAAGIGPEASTATQVGNEGAIGVDDLGLGPVPAGMKKL